MINWQRQLRVIHIGFIREYIRNDLQRNLSQNDFDRLYKIFFPKLNNLYNEILNTDSSINILILEKEFVRPDEDFGINLFSGMFYKRILQNHLERFIIENHSNSKKHISLVKEDIKSLFQLSTFKYLNKYIRNEFALLYSTAIKKSLIDFESLLRAIQDSIGNIQQKNIQKYFTDLNPTLIPIVQHTGIKSNTNNYLQISASSTPIEQADHIVKMLYSFKDENIHFLDMNLIEQISDFVSNKLGLELVLNKIIKYIKSISLEQHFNVYISFKYYYNITESIINSEFLAILNELRKVKNKETTNLQSFEWIQVHDILNYYTLYKNPANYSDIDTISKSFSDAIKQKEGYIIDWFFCNYEALPEFSDDILNHIEISNSALKDFRNKYINKHPFVEKFFNDLSFKASINLQELQNPDVLADSLLKGTIEVYTSEEKWLKIISNLKLSYYQYKALKEKLNNNNTYLSVNFFYENIYSQVYFVDGESLVSALTENYFHSLNIDQIKNALKNFSCEEYYKLRDLLFTCKDEIGIDKRVFLWLSNRNYDFEYLNEL